MYDNSAFARNDAPETSKEAAARIEEKATALELEVLAAIASFGEAGCTSDEVRNRFFSTRPYSSITGRYKALADRGAIGIKAETRPGTSGRKQRVMVALSYDNKSAA